MSLRYSGGIVSNLRNGYNSAPTTVEYLIVAGGGGGGTTYAGSQNGGGGGAGGVLNGGSYAITPGVAITVTVGAGGTAQTYVYTPATNGANSVFGSLTAVYGGRGGGYSAEGSNGGSGGGSSDNTPRGLGVAGQGNAGGTGSSGGSNGGGGGGAAAPGQQANGSAYPGGDGGAGVCSLITGAPVFYGGGGGGTGQSSTDALRHPSRPRARGGAGGGGIAGFYVATAQNTLVGQAGAPNTGGGGGATWVNFEGASGRGGSGVVIIRYPSYLAPATSTTGSPETYVVANWRVYRWVASGSITF